MRKVKQNSEIDITYPILLDGGLSNQVEAQGANLEHDLWTAKLLDENPNEIINAHLSYLEAGARILLTSSYQASIKGLLKAGYNEHRAIELLLLTVSLANEAIKRFKNASNNNENIFKGASIGPYGAFLADGSEYHGNYGVKRNELLDFHLPQFEILKHSDIDFFACETIPSYEEAMLLAELINLAKRPAWISFSCKNDSLLNDGSAVEKIVHELKDHPNIFALGVNCTAPEHIPVIIRTIKRNAPNKRIVVYPNSGEFYNPTTKDWSGTNDPLLCAMSANEWLNEGADIIGGCCRIGPEHIAAMASILNSRR